MRKECVAEPASNPFTVEQCRRFYTEEIRVAAALASPALVNAFARGAYSLTPAKYSATSCQLFTRINPVAVRLWGAV